MTDIIYEKISFTKPNTLDKLLSLFARLSLTGREKDFLISAIQTGFMRNISIFVQSGGFLSCHLFVPVDIAEFVVFLDDSKNYHTYTLFKDGRFVEDIRPNESQKD